MAKKDDEEYDIDWISDYKLKNKKKEKNKKLRELRKSKRG